VFARRLRRDRRLNDLAAVRGPRPPVLHCQGASKRMVLSVGCLEQPAYGIPRPPVQPRETRQSCTTGFHICCQQGKLVGNSLLLSADCMPAMPLPLSGVCIAVRCPARSLTSRECGNPCARLWCWALFVSIALIHIPCCRDCARRMKHRRCALG
jgi:hypothetical protein